MNQSGKIILLHGASSSGKSTIARGVQATIDEPFWHISIDHLRDSGVLPSARIRNGDFNWGDMRPQFFDGFHKSLAAYAQAGNNLIVEHIFDTDGWLSDLAILFAPLDVFFVGVHCSLPELIRRETAQGNRQPGSAEQDYRTIHRGLSYDLEIQSELSLEENIEQLISAWKSRKSPGVFARMVSNQVCINRFRSREVCAALHRAMATCATQSSGWRPTASGWPTWRRWLFPTGSNCA